MKKFLLPAIFLGIVICTFPNSSSAFGGDIPPSGTGFGCVSYSGASYLGPIVLNNNGSVIGCGQPVTGDSDLIPLTDWATWTNYFQFTMPGYHWPAFEPRLGFACDDCWMGSNGMNGSVGIPLGFTINYYGTTYNSVFVNSNGSISFGGGAAAYNEQLSDILGSRPGVVAYGLDLENSRQITQLGATWNTGNIVRHTDFTYRGRTIFEGRPAFVATRINMPTFSSNENDGVRNSFQIMLVDTSGSNDDVNIIVNYGSMRNQSQQGYCADTGSGNICSRVAIGLGNVSGSNTIYNSIVDDNGTVLNGLQTSQLRDGGTYALNTLHLNSTIAGRFIFQMQGGTLPGSIVDAGPGCTDVNAINYLSGASSDNGSCEYPPINLIATGGDQQIALSWHAPLSGNVGGLLSFTITYSPGNSLITGLNNTTTGYILSGLAAGTTYTIQVCDMYSGMTGLFACSTITSSTSTPAPAPDSHPGYGGGGGGGYEPPVITPITVPNPPLLPVITTPVNNPTSPYQAAYDWAFKNGITTQPMANARLEDVIQRYEAAKMIVSYVEKVEKKTIVSNPTCVINSYTDYPLFDAEMKLYIQKICDLGLMGWASPKSLGLILAFRPFDYLTVEEFNIVINRYLADNSHDPAKSNKRIDIMQFLKTASGQ